MPLPAPHHPPNPGSLVQRCLYLDRAGPKLALLLHSSQEFSASPHCLGRSSLCLASLTPGPEPSSALGAFLHVVLWSSSAGAHESGWSLEVPTSSLLPTAPPHPKDRVESSLLPPSAAGFPGEWGLHKALQGRRVRKNVLLGTVGDGFFSVQNLCVYSAKPRPHNSPMK